MPLSNQTRPYMPDLTRSEKKFICTRVHIPSNSLGDFTFVFRITNCSYDICFMLWFRRQNITVTSHDCHSVPNQQPLDCLSNILYGLLSKEESEFRITDPLCRESIVHHQIPKKSQVVWKALPCDNHHPWTTSRNRCSGHYNDFKMSAMASQIIDISIVYSTVCSGVDQRKDQSSMLLACVRGIHRWPVSSPRKWPVTRQMFPFYDVIMPGQQSLWRAIQTKVGI